MLIIKPMAALTEIQKRFIQEYKISGNASQAARKAGYSPKSAHVSGSKLLKNPDIKAIIECSINNDIKVLSEASVEPQKISLPSKIEYASKAWERSSDESKLKEETKFKYFENAGRVLGHVKNEEAVNVNIISADTLESMRSTLMSRGKVVNISSAQASSIIPPPVNTIDIPATQQLSASASQSAETLPEKKSEPTGEGGVEEPQAP